MEEDQMTPEEALYLDTRYKLAARWIYGWGASHRNRQTEWRAETFLCPLRGGVARATGVVAILSVWKRIKGSQFQVVHFDVLKPISTTNNLTDFNAAMEEILK